MPESQQDGSATPPATPSGAQLLNERYRLLDVVGEGGMATVWRAEDTLLHRTVAVKVLREQFASDPEFLERFRTEARSAAALNHAGVVAVHDVGDDGGRHYLVMEYVPGRDLKSLLREEGPLAPSRAVQIGHNLARAVAAAHDAGMIHRDLKPQNVLMAPDGRMKVADFGIARAVSDAGLTAPGIVMGSVHYIAPEQARGEPATQRSDVYSLGVVLYEMLTGQLPHQADSSLGVAQKILREDPEPLAEANPRVGERLAALVERSMARDPRERYQDAGELADALEAYLLASEQVTGALPAPGGGDLPRGAKPKSRGGRARRAGRPAAAGPLLDWPGLGLGVVAALALAGLIVVWIAAINRLQGSAGADGMPVVSRLAAPAATSSPTAPPTATPLPEVDVPEVVGMMEEQAVEELEARGLSASIEPVERDGVALGRVIDQRPEPGEVVIQGSPIKIQVAARGLVVVPPLVTDPSAMDAAVQAAGLTPQRRNVWSGAASPTTGHVIGLDPPPGTHQALNATVQVNVDSGAWLWMGVTFARGLHLGGVNLVTDTVPAGASLRVEPVWAANEPISTTYQARVALGDAAAFAGGGGAVVAESTHALLEDQSVAGWEVGRDMPGTPFDVAVPGDTDAGDYVLWIELLPDDGSATRESVGSAALSRVIDARVRIKDIVVTDG